MNKNDIFNLIYTKNIFFLYMKLVNHEGDFNNILTEVLIDKKYIESELNNTSDNLRIIEDKFYKIFDLNPCPMSITEIKNNIIVDVNDAFLNIMNIKDKSSIINKKINKINFIKDKDRLYILNKIYKDGVIKNHVCEFRTMNNKRKKGMFSGSIVNINDKKCLLLTCQIVNKKSVFGIFKTYLML